MPVPAGNQAGHYPDVRGNVSYGMLGKIPDRSHRMMEVEKCRGPDGERTICLKKRRRKIRHPVSTEQDRNTFPSPEPAPRQQFAAISRGNCRKDLRRILPMPPDWPILSRVSAIKPAAISLKDRNYCGSALSILSFRVAQTFLSVPSQWLSSSSGRQKCLPHPSF